MTGGIFSNVDEQPTGVCPECGGTVPMLGRRLALHTQRCIRPGPGGIPEEHPSNVRCDGSGGQPAAGTTTRPAQRKPAPDRTRPGRAA